VKVRSSSITTLERRQSFKPTHCSSDGGFIISQISVKNGQEHPIIIESGEFKGANQLSHDRKRFFSNHQRVFKKSTYTASCRNSGPYGPFQPSRLADCSTTVAETSKVGGIAEWFLNENHAQTG